MQCCLMAEKMNTRDSMSYCVGEAVKQSEYFDLKYVFAITAAHYVGLAVKHFCQNIHIGLLIP